MVREQGAGSGEQGNSVRRGWTEGEQSGGLAARSLKNCGMRDAAQEMQSRVTSSGSYDEALAIICEYVEPVSEDEYEAPEMEMG